MSQASKILVEITQNFLENQAFRPSENRVSKKITVEITQKFLKPLIFVLKKTKVQRKFLSKLRTQHLHAAEIRALAPD